MAIIISVIECFVRIQWINIVPGVGAQKASYYLSFFTDGELTIINLEIWLCSGAVFAFHKQPWLLKVTFEVDFKIWFTDTYTFYKVGSVQQITGLQRWSKTLFTLGTFCS